MQMDFIEHMDDYIGFVKERQIQTMDRLKAMRQSIDEQKLIELKNKDFSSRLIRYEQYAKNGIKALEELKQNKFDKINGNKANEAFDNKIFKKLIVLTKRLNLYLINIKNIKKK